MIFDLQQSNGTFLASSTKENITFDDSQRQRPALSSPHKKNNRKPMTSTNSSMATKQQRTSGGKQAWKQQAFEDSNSEDDNLPANSRISKGTVFLNC